MKYLNLLILAGSTTIGLSAMAAGIDWSQLPPAATNANVTFAQDIQPIFQASCVRCHGARRPRAELRLDSLDGVMQGTGDGPIVKVGDSANSLLVKAISRLDPKTAMPPKRRARPGGPGGPGSPGGLPPGLGGPPPSGGMPPHNFGPPAKPLTPEQVGLVRAWIDQGAK